VSLVQPAIPRTLLLTGTRPGRDGVGAILLSDQLAMLPPGSVDVVHVLADSAIGADVVITQVGDHEWRVSFPRVSPAPYGRIRRAARTLLSEWRLDRMLVRAAAQLALLARSRGIAQIWSVLDAPISIRLAPALAQASGLPLRTLVWDDIEHQVAYFGLNRLAARACRRDFEAAVRRGISLAVIGESMQACYLKRYGKKGIIVRHGVKPLGRSPAAIPAGTGAIRIGFAGSVTARSAFDALLGALDRLGWTIDGREVTLVLMGGRFDLRSSVPRRIECLGWRSPEETLAILGGCTLNYLPQPFEADKRAMAELSFPTKTSTMIATGVPILVHAPEYASLVRFGVQHPFAFVCHELAPDALAATLRTACTDTGARQQVLASARRVLAETLSDEVHRRQFLAFIADEVGTPVIRADLVSA
jgi:glycosyltransferase involved in cell wall biosynthesis